MEDPHAAGDERVLTPFRNLFRLVSRGSLLQRWLAAEAAQPALREALCAPPDT